MLELVPRPDPSEAAPAAPERDPIARPGALTEVSGGALDGAAVGLALMAAAAPGRTVVWVQDRLSRLERGRPFPAGMARLLGFAPDLIVVEARRPDDALWAMEEALGASAVGAVVGEIHGGPRALSFTATKRLSLRAARSGAVAMLLRSEGSGLSVAERWRAESRPSAANPDDAAAPGAPRWDIRLARPKGRAPGHWIASHGGSHDAGHGGRTGATDGTAPLAPHRLDLVSLLPDGALEAGEARRGHAAG